MKDENIIDKRKKEKEENSIVSLPNVLGIGLVGFFMNLASSIVYGGSLVVFDGIISQRIIILVRAFSESIGTIAKILAGVISDVLNSRKSILLLGYGSMVLTKSIFIFTAFGERITRSFPFITAEIIVWIFIINSMLDRLMNASRDGTRDALVADSTPLHLRSEAYGFRKALTSVGSIIGGFGSFFVFSKYETIFGVKSGLLSYILAIIPTIVATLVLIFMVHDIKKTPTEIKKDKEKRGDASFFKACREQFDFKTLLKNKEQLKVFFIVLIYSSLLNFARLNDFVLFSRVVNLGYPTYYSTLMFSLLYLFITIFSYIFGKFGSNKKLHNSMLYIGGFCLLITNLIMGLVDNLFLIILATFFLGIFIGIFESVVPAIISRNIPESIRATCFGTFYCSTGFFALLINIVYGVYIKSIPVTTLYLLSVGTTLLSLLFLFIFRKTLTNKSN